jgi:hypothetical protein
MIMKHFGYWILNFQYRTRNKKKGIRNGNSSKTLLSHSPLILELETWNYLIQGQRISPPMVLAKRKSLLDGVIFQNFQKVTQIDLMLKGFLSVPADQPAVALRKACS